MKITEFQTGHAYYRVDIIESERGWGSKVEDTFYYDNPEEAQKFVTDYNEKYNNKPVVPDWYMVAQYVGLCAAPR